MNRLMDFFTSFAESSERRMVELIILAAAIIFFIGFYFNHELQPVDSSDGPQQFQAFEVKPGDGFRAIASALASDGLIHSRLAFELLAIGKGAESQLKPGTYRLSPEMSASELLNELVTGTHHQVTVTIPEGDSMYDIDRILSAANVITPGSLVVQNASNTIEGTLFPDTYEFFTDSDVQDIIGKFEENFKIKAVPLLAADQKNRLSNLILASILQKEVPDIHDQEIVAGILEKRIKAGMRLQVDATVCYAKTVASYPTPKSCYPLTPLDFKIDSPYNTYLHGGLPLGAIGNPGVSAITAALHPIGSSYWFYLSDPKTGKTIFAKTLDEQQQNRVKYLLR